MGTRQPLLLTQRYGVAYVIPGHHVIRHLLDLFIFFARHMVLAFAAFAVLTWFFLRLHPLRHDSGDSPWRGRTLLTAVALGLIGVFAAIGGWYVTAKGFAGEVEPVVSCLSWLVQTGRPLYTAFDAAERYSVLYGPSVFLTNGLFLKILGPSLASAKVASIFGSLGSLVFLYAAVARRSRDLLALTVTALAVLYYWTQGFAVYLVRPDALLLFAVGLGLFAGARSRRVLALVTVAVAAGFAINLKAHGAIYFLPVFALVLRRFGRRDVVLCGLGTVAVVIAPFFVYPQVSLVNYVGWLSNAVSHGLEAHTLGQTLRYAAFLLLPVIGLVWAAPERPLLWRRFRVELWLLVPVFGLTTVLAAKPGAGPVHLLPLVPTTMFLLGKLLRAGYLEVAGAARRPRPVQVVLAATLLTALLAGSVNAYRAVRYVSYEIGRTPDLALDVKEIMSAYPGLTISMACGGENLSFQTTWLRPLLVFADNPLLIDPISVMDSSLSGREISPKTYLAISEGRVAVWLVPRRQVPFSKQNWYAPHKPLFPVSFREHFMACYTPRDHSRYFDLWFWNGLPESATADPVYAGGASPASGAMAPLVDVP